MRTACSMPVAAALAMSAIFGAVAAHAAEGVPEGDDATSDTVPGVQQPPTASFPGVEPPAAALPAAPPPSLPSYPSPQYRPLPAYPRDEGLASNREPESRWYGWQTLAADGVSLLVLLLAFAGDSEGAAFTGAGGYFLASPAIHVGHENYWQAGVSLGSRILLPAAGGALGVQLAGCSGGEPFCGFGEFIGGLLLGAATAITIDATWLAWEAPKPPAGQLRLAPAPMLGRDTLGLQLDATW